MRSHSFLSLFTLSSLVAAAVAHDDDAPASSSRRVVTVMVHSTITTCPTPPPPCSSVFETGSTSPVTTTSESSAESSILVSTSSQAPSSSGGPSGSVSSQPPASETTTSSVYSLSSVPSSSLSSTAVSSESQASSSAPESSITVSASQSYPVSTSSGTETESCTETTVSQSSSETAPMSSSSSSGPSSSLESSSSQVSSSQVSSSQVSSSQVSSSQVSSSLVYSTSSQPSSTSYVESTSSYTTSTASPSPSSSAVYSSSSSLSSSESSTLSSASSSLLSSTSSYGVSSSSSASPSSSLSSSQFSSSLASSTSSLSSSQSSSSLVSSTSSLSSSQVPSSTSSSWSTTTSKASSSSISSSTTSTRSSSTSSISAPACTDYWLSKIAHQGKAPYAASDYKVFRNVKDFGAKGDGTTDDTAAINSAISSGSRCGPEGHSCGSTTTTPALIYFPPGTYIVSQPIIDYYYTMLVGNPSCMPVLKASSSFNSRFFLDGDQYQTDGHLGWGATNVFWRQIRNFVIDLTAVNPSVLVAGVHWPTGQATSLQNIVFKMSTASGNQHQGLFIEEGSGGWMNDLVFYGGAQGMSVGNQQFTMRNLTFHNSVTAIQQLWDWGWTYQGVSINNCQVGLDISAVADGALKVASVTFIDSEINNTPVGISYGSSTVSTPAKANGIILENVNLNNVPVAIQGPNKATVLSGSTGKSTISAWGKGNSYKGTTGPTALPGAFTANTRPAGLTAGSQYYERSKPQYENLPVSQFVSIKSSGAVGDGVKDDAAAINKALADAAAAGKIVFFDFGVYKVESTITIPPGSKIVGEAYPVILSAGSYFTDINNPKPVVQVGTSGSVGTIEWSDMIVSTQGAQAGAILIEWNLSSPGTPSGMWDVHTRIGGFQGSNLQVADCKWTNSTVSTPNTKCIAAFASMHITKSASGIYMENVWLWVADHDIEDPALTRVTIYAGRGLLVESTIGNIWMYGTAVEHHVLYEYQFSGTKNIVAGQIQTETAYYQPNPDATVPFPALTAYNDPVIPSGQSGWGLRVKDSSNVLVYGAGLYSFFDNYSTKCSDGPTEYCQTRIFSVENSAVSVYNLNTVGTTKMFTVNGVDGGDYSQNVAGFSDSIALFRN